VSVEEAHDQPLGSVGEHSHPLPDDPVLAEAAQALEEGRLAGDILDDRWRLCYVSSELRNLVGNVDDEKLAYGTNSLLRNRVAPEVWRLSDEAGREWWETDGPYARHDLPEDEQWLRGELGDLADAFLRLSARPPPIAWAQAFVTTFADRAHSAMNRVNVRLVRPDGALAGILCVYVGGGLRASVQAMLARGSSTMYERMAALTEPARRPAAVLFADLEASSVLSRRLSSKAYFELIRELTTLTDEAVIANGGIVGKHAGDGVSALFLAEQCGGEEAAAEGSLLAARAIQAAAAEVRCDGVAPQVNAGVHWGATLVVGQVVTGGRLEVTALGDEVNEAARIQEVAREGAIFASKDVVERLAPAAAARIGIDPDEVSYEILGELPGAGEKAKRDAGGIAVTPLQPPSPPAG
jgi:class 3 adenylate cyclase